jgi:hypothetical protein
MKYLGLFIISVLLFTSSCNDEERCYELTDTFMVTRFVDSGSKSMDSLIVWGVGQEEGWIYDSNSSVEKRYPLPLSLSSDTTGFVLFVNGRADTVFIHHSMQMRLVSESCGFAPYYELDSFSFTNGIDSVGLSDSDVNPNSIEKDEDQENITIYFDLAVN